MRSFRRLYWIGLFTLAALTAGKGVLQDENSVYGAWVGLLLVIGIVLGALTSLIAKSPIPNPWRRVLVVVVGYHALFGPVMLAYMLLADHSRNDDLPLRLYPHVIELINSFE